MTTNNYTQLEFFPPTFEMSMKERMETVEQKQEKYRKAQFGKIGRVEKRCADLEQDVDIIKRGLCNGQLSQDAQVDIKSAFSFETMYNDLLKRVEKLEKQAKPLEKDCYSLKWAVS